MNFKRLWVALAIIGAILIGVTFPHLIFAGEEDPFKMVRIIGAALLFFGTIFSSPRRA